MTVRVWVAVLAAGLLLGLEHGVELRGADTKANVVAPIPRQILTAKKIFIANGGGDERSYEGWPFSGGPDRSYNQFYAAMKNAGSYELVDSPAEAYLIFEIQFSVPAASPAAARTGLSTVAFDPQFRLVIRDPKTNALLWAFREHLECAILQGNRDKNFDNAAARIVADLQSLAARASAVAGNGNP